MPKISLQWFLIRRIAFWGVVLAAAVGLFFFVRAFTICWRLTSLAGIPPASCAGEAVSPLETPVVGNNQNTPSPTLTPEPSESEDIEYPTWDGASRINILFVGFRGGQPTEADCPFCTDTLILLTVDPITKTAGMLSIPRDMWVNIPGFGYSRINTAYSSGEGSKLPGGGPELARKTVEQFLGVPIQYYAQVDFNTFAQFIDEIGGIDIFNDENLRLDQVGSGKDKIKLTCCGMRHLRGEVALAYARCRDEGQGCKDGDIGRARRQQKVILAIREKVLSPEVFPVLIGKAQTLYEQFSAGIRTNMPFDTALRLGILAKDIPVESIKNGVIDYSMVTLDNVTLGGANAAVMKPLPDKIRELRDQVFTSGGALSPLAAQNDPAALMQADGARVRILNGSYSPGLDVNTGNYLLTQGVPVTEVGAADRAYDATVLVLYSPKLYTLKYLQTVFGITENALIWIKPDPTSTVDVEVRLGNNWANSNPMP